MIQPTINVRRAEGQVILSGDYINIALSGEDAETVFSIIKGHVADTGEAFVWDMDRRQWLVGSVADMMKEDAA